MIRKLLSAVRPAAPQPGYVCPACGLDARASYPAEAALLAGLHDQLHHNGHVTALVGVAA